ncbi:hypothetical protein [Ferrimonas marina]|uniref:Uncharacterized protein n=1 Tax=Ferrimonas marina TaxID=299255 RepID=A0A1M5UB55_9GAMM|nr:hypothetical protein [Ferrimonas marina]SHH60151.1 hypothetical protein SAMN02745129_2483 [Ferrimonas marina]
MEALRQAQLALNEKTEPLGWGIYECAGVEGDHGPHCCNGQVYQLQAVEGPLDTTESGGMLQCFASDHRAAEHVRLGAHRGDDLCAQTLRLLECLQQNP